MTAQPLLQFGTVALDPAPDRRAVGAQAALADSVLRHRGTRASTEDTQRTAQTISSGSVCRHLKISGRTAFFTISSGYQPPPAQVATHPPDRHDSAAAGRLQIVRDLYSEAYGHLACDLFCCRQTLEHIPEPTVFLNSMRRALGSTHDRTVVFFEVPNELYTLRHKGIWDIIYEHVSYFWSAPLARLFSESGFAVRTVRETYGHQFLCIEATPASRKPESYRPDSEQMERVPEEVRVFGQTFDSTLAKAAQVQGRHIHESFQGPRPAGVCRRHQPA